MGSAVGGYLGNASAATRIVWSGAAGLAAGALAAAFSGSQVPALIGWDVAALSFLLMIWPVVWPLDAEETGRRATRLDPSRAVADVLVVSAGVAILTAVALALVRAGHAHGATKALLLALVVTSVALSWLAIQTVFTLRYAQLYYRGAPGGIDFHETDPPNFADFAYVAFTLGMTFQTSDTDFTTKVIRRTALQHSLISYLFGAVILGLVVNIVASLL